MNDIYSRTNNICLVFLTIFTATIALMFMKPVLIPLIFSIFAYSLMTPLVLLIKNKMGIPKNLAILLSLILLFFILTLFILVVINSIENFVTVAPKYKQSLTESLIFLESKLTSLNVNVQLTHLQESIQKLPFISYAQTLTGHLFSFMGYLILVFVFTLFMMTGKSRQGDNRENEFLNDILKKISLYLSIKSTMSLLTGFFVWITLLLFGVDLAFIFGILTVLLNFIPTIGSLLAIVLPLPVVFLQYKFSWPFFVILSISGSIQFCIGNVLEPKIMGGSMDMHPIAVLVCLIFWGMVWGIPGMFLAVPITAVFKILFEKIEATQILAEILAGRLPSKRSL